eukprot:985859-Pleurochrysis_carterae.AAC.1
MSGSESDERIGSKSTCTRTRTKRDGSESEDATTDEKCRALVYRDHQCTNRVNVEGESLPCDYPLWARLTPAAVASLKKQRVHFRKNLSQAEQKQAVYDSIEFEGVSGNLHSDSDPIDAPVRYMVGPTAGRQRA